MLSLVKEDYLIADLQEGLLCLKQQSTIRII